MLLRRTTSRLAVVFTDVFWATVCKTVRPILSDRCLFYVRIILGPYLVWQNGWMDQDAAWYTEVGLGPGNIVLDWDLVPPPPQKGGTIAPFNFRPMSIAAKRLDGSRCHLVRR